MTKFIKIIAPILVLVCLAMGLSAQSIERSVIGAMGGSSLPSGGPQLTYQVGETFTNTLSAGANILTQGFEQGKLTVPPISGILSVCAAATTILSDMLAGGTWSSASSAIATVDPVSGIVSGASAGTAVINYTFSDGSYATTIVTVNVPPAGITGNAQMCTGGSTITLGNTSANGTWSGGSVGLATINSSGVVTPGATQGITSFIYDNGCGSAAVATATVNAAPAGITGNGLFCAGGSTLQLANTSTNGTWSSSNVSVASISATGLATSGIAGSTTISYSNGCGTTTLNLNVIGSPIMGVVDVQVGGAVSVLNDQTAGGVWSNSVPAVASMVTNTSNAAVIKGLSAGKSVVSYVVGAGCTVTTTVTVYAPVLCVGTSIQLSDATPGSGTWTSGSGGIATVIAATGVVTGAAAGTVTINYIVAGIAHPHVVTVYPLTPTVVAPTVCQGSTITATNGTTGGGTWSSSNVQIHTVTSGGVITGVNGGPADVVFLTAAGCMNAKSITVNPSVPITGPSSVCAGQTITLANGISGGTWSTSSGGIATVSGGTVGGVAAGNVNIVYSLPTGCQRSVSLTVKPLQAITGGSSVCQSQSVTMSNSTTGGGTWSSSNTLVVTAAGGVVTGVTNGAANIFFTTPLGCVASKPVTVYASAVISGTVVICPNQTSALSTTVAGGTWTTGSNGIATVSNTGVVKGVAPGRININYILPGGCQTTVTVTVGACRESDTSSTASVSETVLTGDIHIFPNPNKGTFTIAGTLASTQDEEVMIDVLDMLGQVVYRNNATAKNGLLNEQVRLGSIIANSMYMVSIRSGNEYKVFHIVVEQ